ncbi:MAG TPA: HTTM domain-containing protein [Chthoniobacterales bacterium]|jgi:hypothetical protein|nr:HTTM domain-containing protein [Chthoniobacterales bacterium]
MSRTSMISLSLEHPGTDFRPNPFRQFQHRLIAFLFHPSSDRWLSLLRIGIGIQVILYCLSLRSDWTHVFAQGTEGWVSRDIMEAVAKVQAPLVPRIGWLVTVGSYLGLAEEKTLSLIWFCLLVAAIFLVIGLFSRTSAIIAWFLYLTAVNSSGLVTYGVDNFTNIGLFYLLVAPFPDRMSLDRVLWKSPIKNQHLHGFFRRVLQIHVCIIYFFGGLTKCLGPGWWTGESMWMALTRPPFNVLPVSIVDSWRTLLPLIGIAVCLLEIGYPVFIWPKKTRLIWLLAIIGMHIGIGLMMGLYLFALIMIILNLAAFGPEFIFRHDRSENFRSATLG